MNVGTLTISLAARTAGLARAGAQVKIFEKGVLASVQKINTGIASIGMAFSALTIPISAIGIGATKLFAEFEFSLAKVEGLVGIAHNTTMKWGADVLRLSKTIGKSANDMGNALYFVASGGIRSANTMKVVKASAQASAAGMGETATIAGLVTNVMNAYGEANISVAETMDILVTAVREGQVEAGDLTIALSKILPISSAMGVTFNEVGAAVGALTRTGTKATTAGMMMTRLLASFQKPGKLAKDTMLSLGSSFEEMRDIIMHEKGGVLKALLKIRQLINDSPDGAEKMAKLMPNIRAYLPMLDLLGNNLEKNKSIWVSMLQPAGNFNRLIAATAGTFQYKFMVAINAGREALIQIGHTFAKTLIPVIHSFAEKMRELSKWWTSLPAGAQQLIIKITLLTGVVGPLLIVFSSLAGILLSLLRTVGAFLFVLLKFTKYLWGLRVALLATSTASVTLNKRLWLLMLTGTTTTRRLMGLKGLFGLLVTKIKGLSIAVFAFSKQLFLLAGRLLLVTLNTAAILGLAAAILLVVNNSKEWSKWINDSFVSLQEKRYASLIKSTKATVNEQMQLWKNYEGYLRELMQQQPDNKGNKSVLSQLQQLEAKRKALAAAQVKFNSADSFDDKETQFNNLRKILSEIQKIKLDAMRVSRNFGLDKNQVYGEQELLENIILTTEAQNKLNSLMIDNPLMRTSTTATSFGDLVVSSLQKTEKDAKKIINRIKKTVTGMFDTTGKGAGPFPSDTKSTALTMQQFFQQQYDEMQAVDVAFPEMLNITFPEDAVNDLFMDADMAILKADTSARQFGDTFDYLGAQISAYEKLMRDVHDGGFLLTPEQLTQMQEYMSKLDKLREKQKAMNYLTDVNVKLMQAWKTVANTLSGIMQQLGTMIGGAFGDMVNQITPYITLLSKVIALVKAFGVIEEINDAKKKAHIGTTVAETVAVAGLSAAQASLAVTTAIAGATLMGFPAMLAAIPTAVGATMVGMSSVPIAAGMAMLAHGGIIPSGYDNDTFPAMLSSNEAVIPLDKLPQLVGMSKQQSNQKVEFIIEGRVLKGILADANNMTNTY